MAPDIRKGLQAGFFRYLTKPIKVNELMATVRMALETADQRAAEESRPFPSLHVDGHMLEMDGVTLAGKVKAASDVAPFSAPPHAPAARTAGLRILVAEDHPVNQEVARQLLERLGHRVVMAADGRAALAALEQSGREAFDLVLMDLQMPVMGGLEATAAIRNAERLSGTHLPIVALTAHAMQGDRARCLAAGMDGYLPKPIDVDELVATIERFGGDPNARRGVPAPPAATGAIFDEQAALAHTGDDRRLLKRIISLFRSDQASALRRIERAIAQRDGEALRLAAHALKGSSATVGAAAGRDAAAELEQIGRSNEFDDGDRALARLREQIVLLDDAFAAAGLTARQKRAPAPRRRSRPTLKKKGRS
jgi:CheY-like chemotaxis protein/HPt (histidine-containing phosphotransfer) domain-containing protein